MKKKPKLLKAKVGSVEVKVYRCQRRVGGEKYETFQVADYSTGKRRLVTFADEGKAMAEADRIAKLISSGQVAALDMGPTQRASFGRATELLRPTGISLEIAASIVARSVEILGDERILEAVSYFAKKNPARLPQVTVRKAVDDLIEAKKGAGKSLRYRKDLEYRLGTFADKFKINLSAVTGPDIQSFLDGLKLSPRSYINFRRVIGTLFKFAKRRGWLPKDHDEADNLEKIDGANGEITTYTPAEMVRLLNAASVGFRPCIAIGAFAGLRSSEIERLDWRHIDLTRRFITVQGARKRGTPSRRVVPITENLAAWLSLKPKTQGKVWAGSHDEFYEAQQETAKATKAEIGSCHVDTFMGGTLGFIGAGLMGTGGEFSDNRTLSQESELRNRGRRTAKEAVVAQAVTITGDVMDWERKVIKDFVGIGKSRAVI